MPRGPSPPVRTMQTMMSVSEAPEMKALEPFRT